MTIIGAAMLLCAQLLAQQGTTAPQAASGEMARLAKALAGDWNNVETMERSSEFPNGGERRGNSHCELSTGGTTLTCEGQSDGSAGKLEL